MSDAMQSLAPNVHDGRMDIYVIKSGPIAGTSIKLKRVQPILLSKVMNSVELPSRPTYETRTVSGRVQIMPMDEKAAKETPGGEAQWKYYQEESERALSTQNDRVVMAIFALGTECPVPEDGWDEVQRMLGIDVPTDKNLRRAHYLVTNIDDAEELNEIISRIMRLGGVDEATIRQAEDSFRDSVRDKPEQTGRVVDPEPNTSQTPSF